MSRKHRSHSFQSKKQNLSSKNQNQNIVQQSKFAIALVDIVIPVLDMSALLMKCLDSIPAAAGDISYQIIVVDNGSKSEELQKYKQYGKEKFGDKLHILEQHRNIGFPAACNRGARFGYAPLLFFLNDDVVLYPNSIDRLVRAMDDPKVGAVGMKLLFSKDSTDPRRPAGKVQHVGLSTNVRGDFIHNFMGWSPDNPRVLKVTESYVITGAAMMTRKIVFKQLKGFNEEYGLGTYEDVEYCLMLRDMGYNIKVEQTAIGEHFVGATALDKQIAYPLNQNRMLLQQHRGGKLFYTDWEIW